MNKILFIVLAIVVIMCKNVFASYDYKISDYKVTDTSGSSIALYFNTNHDSNSLSSDSRSMIELANVLSWYKNKNDEKKSFELNFNMRSNSNEANRLIELGKSGIENLNVNFNYKKYIFGDMFFSITPRGSFDYGNRIKDGFFSKVSVNVAMGAGRIDDVIHAKIAVDMLDELNSKKCIKNQPTNEQIERFAEFLSQVACKKFYDKRDKTSYDLTAIYNFLKREEIIGISEQDGEIKTFTTINDIWNFTNKTFRLRGQEFYIEYIPTKYLNYNQKSEGLNIIYRYEKPLNNKLQLSINVENINEIETSEKYGINETRLSQMIRNTILMSYYPNLSDVITGIIVPIEVDFNQIENKNIKYKEKTGKINSSITLSYGHTIDNNSNIGITGNISAGYFTANIIPVKKEYAVKKYISIGYTYKLY